MEGTNGRMATLACGNRRKAVSSFTRLDFVYLFCAGGLVGTTYEFLVGLVMRGALEDHSGSLLTPFNGVYGIGAVVMVLCLYRIVNPVKLYAAGALLGGVIEYVGSFLQETILGCKSWDYSGRTLNIGGRTTLPYMLVWGVLGLIAVRFLFPAMLQMIHMIPTNVHRVLGMALLVVVAADAVLSLTAVACYAQRAVPGVEINGFAAMIETWFPDSYMSVHYPNMIL